MKENKTDQVTEKGLVKEVLNVYYNSKRLDNIFDSIILYNDKEFNMRSVVAYKVLVEDDESELNDTFGPTP